MARSRTVLIPDCARRCRDAQLELDDALRELQTAIERAGWVELFSHVDVSGRRTVTYQHPGRGRVDPVSGFPTGSAVQTLDGFIAGLES